MTKNERALRLGDWVDTLALEKNCAQVILSGPEGGAVWGAKAPCSDTTRVVGKMKHKPVKATNSFLGLSADGFVALAFLHTMYMRQEGPDSREVVITLEDLAVAVGMESHATEPARLLLEELLSGSFTGYLSSHDGTHAWRKLRALEWYALDQETGVCTVRLPDIVAENLREDFVVYLTHETLLELKRQDPYAVRIWAFARAQNLTAPRVKWRGMAYCVFATRYTAKNWTHTWDALLPLAERETEALERLEVAVQAVNSNDSRYALHIEKGESWLLKMRRVDVESDDIPE